MPRIKLLGGWKAHSSFCSRELLCPARTPQAMHAEHNPQPHTDSSLAHSSSSSNWACQGAPSAQADLHTMLESACTRAACQRDMRDTKGRNNMAQHLVAAVTAGNSHPLQKTQAQATMQVVQAHVHMHTQAMRPQDVPVILQQHDTRSMDGRSSRPPHTHARMHVQKRTDRQ